MQLVGEGSAAIFTGIFALSATGYRVTVGNFLWPVGACFGTGLARLSNGVHQDLRLWLNFRRTPSILPHFAGESSPLNLEASTSLSESPTRRIRFVDLLG